MAELATIARPYAEALFKAAGRGADASALADQVEALGRVAASPAVAQFADNPKVAVADVLGVVQQATGNALAPAVSNLLQVVLDNGRLGAMGEIAQQFRALVNAASGVSDARIISAFAMSEADIASTTAALEKRFGRKLKPHVEVDAALIGGIRVVVGDEVLDASVKARLESMKATLLA